MFVLKGANNRFIDRYDYRGRISTIYLHEALLMGEGLNKQREKGQLMIYVIYTGPSSHSHARMKLKIKPQEIFIQCEKSNYRLVA